MKNLDHIPMLRQTLAELLPEFPAWRLGREDPEVLRLGLSLPTLSHLDDLPTLWMGFRSVPGGLQVKGVSRTNKLPHRWFGEYVCPNWDWFPLGLTPPPGKVLVPRLEILITNLVEPDGTVTEIDPLVELWGEILRSFERAFTCRPATYERLPAGWFAPFGADPRYLIPNCPFGRDEGDGRGGVHHLRLGVQEAIDRHFDRVCVKDSERSFHSVSHALDEDCIRPSSSEPERNVEGQAMWVAQYLLARGRLTNRNPRSFCSLLRSGEKACAFSLPWAEVKGFIDRLPFVPAIGKVAPFHARHGNTPGEIVLDETTRGKTDPLTQRYGYHGGGLPLPTYVRSLPENVCQGVVLAGSWRARLRRTFNLEVRYPLEGLRLRYLDEDNKVQVLRAEKEELLDETRREELVAAMIGLKLPRRMRFGFGPGQGGPRNRAGWKVHEKILDGHARIERAAIEIRDTVYGPEVDLFLGIDETRLFRDGDKLFVAGSAKATIRIVEDADLPGPKDDQGRSLAALHVEPNKVFGKHVDILEAAVARAALAAGVDPARLPERSQPWDHYVPAGVTDLEGIFAAASRYYGVDLAPVIEDGHLLVEAFCYADSHTGATMAEEDRDTLWTLIQNWSVCPSPAYRQRMFERFSGGLEEAHQLLGCLAQSYQVEDREGTLYVSGPGLAEPVPAKRVEKALVFGVDHTESANDWALLPDGWHLGSPYDEAGNFRGLVWEQGTEGSLLEEGWLVIVFQGGDRRLTVGEGRYWPRIPMQDPPLERDYLVIPPAAGRLLQPWLKSSTPHGRLHMGSKELAALNKLVYHGMCPVFGEGRSSEIWGDGVSGAGHTFNLAQIAKAIEELFGRNGRLTRTLLNRVSKVLNPRDDGLRFLADADPRIHPEEIEFDPAWLDYQEQRVTRRMARRQMTREEAIASLEHLVLEGDTFVVTRPPTEPGDGYVAMKVVRGRPYGSPMVVDEPRARINSFVLETKLRGDRDGDALYGDPCGRDPRIFAELRLGRLSERYAKVLGKPVDVVALAQEFHPKVVDWSKIRSDQAGLAVTCGNDLEGLPSLRRRAIDQSAREGVIKSMARLRSFEYRSLQALCDEQQLALWRLFGELGIEKTHVEFGRNGSLREALTEAEMVEAICTPMPRPSQRKKGRKHLSDRWFRGPIFAEAEAMKLFRDLVDGPEPVVEAEARLATAGLKRILVDNRDLAEQVPDQWVHRLGGYPPTIAQLFRLKRYGTDLEDKDTWVSLCEMGPHAWLEDIVRILKDKLEPAFPPPGPYAGVGARKTPAEVQAVMTRIAAKMASEGHILRSGGAVGADSAFEAGAGEDKEIFTADGIIPREAFSMVAGPYGHRKFRGNAVAAMGDWLGRLMARNAQQILGRELDDPSGCVICWTPAAAVVGGTGQAIRFAQQAGVPVYNLADPECWRVVMEWLGTDDPFPGSTPPGDNMAITIGDLKVVNKRTWQGPGLYIGRKREGMHYGNPFSHRSGTLAGTQVVTVEEAVDCYERWLAGEFPEIEPERRAWILEQIPTIQDNVLICFCAPHSCHGVPLAKRILAARESKPAAPQEQPMIFRDGLWFLSNMYPTPITYEGRTYSCVEAAYQAAKCAQEGGRGLFEGIDGFTAKRRGRTVALREDWEEVKLPIMAELIDLKFQDDQLRRKLLAVQGPIRHHTTDGKKWWQDTFWGLDQFGQGEDHLGRLLTEARDRIRRQRRYIDDEMNDPEWIFVFGSNLAGRHGAGAAKYALEHHAAKYGKGCGPQGRSYALPTKDEALRTLPLDRIAAEVETFLAKAAKHPELTFRVTRIGCGLAGYRDEEIAPLFRDAPEHCLLPEAWRPILEPQYQLKATRKCEEITIQAVYSNDTTGTETVRGTRVETDCPALQDRLYLVKLNKSGWTVVDKTSGYNLGIVPAATQVEALERAVERFNRVGWSQLVAKMDAAC